VQAADGRRRLDVEAVGTSRTRARPPRPPLISP
jgi:hypothetical protein